MKMYYLSKSSHAFAAMEGMPSRWVILLVILLVSMATAGHCQTVSSATLELSRQAAVALAIRKNIDLKSVALDKAIARAALARSRGIYDPILSSSLSTEANSSPGDDFRTKSTNAALELSRKVPTGATITAATQSGFSSIESPSAGLFARDWQSSVGVTISQPLLKNFGKETTELNITLAANSYQGSLEQFRFFIIDTVFLVTTSYDRLYKLRQTEKEREVALTSAIKFLDEINKTAQQRVIGKLEIANAEYAIYQRRKDLVDASRAVKDQEETLRFLIGMEEKQELIPLDPPSREEPPESEAQAVKTALAARSDLKQLKLTLAASELQERVAKRQTLPDLSVEISGGLNGLASGGGGSFEQIGRGEAGEWAAGLLFSVPLGNTTARNDYLVNRLRSEQLRHQIASFSWQVRNAVEADMRALISARLQIQLADKSREIGKIRLEEYKKNQKQGMSTVQDVIDSENDLIFAQISQLEATETFAFTVALLWRDMGTLLDHHNIHIDSATSEKSGEETNAEATPKKDPSPREDALPEQDNAQPRKENKGKAEAVPDEKSAALPIERSQAAELPGGRAKAGRYTLQVGEFTTKVAMAETRAKIESAGLPSLVREGHKRKISVIRLRVGDFPDQDSARKKLATLLRQAKVAGFISLNDEQRYCAYAGSFSGKEKAAKEQRRLADLGIDSRLQNTFVGLPTFLLTAGSFPTREAALTEANRLMAQGVRTIVVENG